MVEKALKRDWNLIVFTDETIFNLKSLEEGKQIKSIKRIHYQRFNIFKINWWGYSFYFKVNFCFLKIMNTKNTWKI